MIIRGKSIIVKDAEHKRYNGGARVLKQSGVGITVERTKSNLGDKRPYKEGQIGIAT